MLSKLLKRFRPPPAPQAPLPSPAPPLPTPEAIDWAQRLLAAQDNDTALLTLAQEAPKHAIRLSAIQSLRETSSLQQAAQTFRGHDKTLYRAAQSALDARKKQQETRAIADRLLNEARTLLQETAAAPLPANRLAELDQGWRKLDATQIDDALHTEFSNLYTELQQRSLKHLEHQRDTQRRQEAAAAEEAARKAEQEAARKIATTAAAMQEQQQRDAQRQEREQARLRHQQALQKLQALEAALAEGRVSEAEKELPRLRTEIHTQGNDELTTRLHVLQSEIQHLKSWQNWGGLQAREALLQEAEALAKTATDETSPLPPSETKPHAKAIDRLRAQWKKLDQLGSPSNQTLWQRFDAALKTAWQPVALQKQKLGETRQENLNSRLTLLAGLEAFPLAEPVSNEPPTDWRALLHALAEFRTAWRKHGPIEHTVPHAEREALQARLNQALSRLETPLDAARERSRRHRHQLIEQARALDTPTLPKEAARRVRELQSQWQQQDQPPLPHKEETQLRESFKSATDAIFTRLNEARLTHQARQQTHQADRETLITELGTLLEIQSAETIRRQLGELETRWRTAGELPKPLADRLDAAWRETRQQLKQHLASLHQQQWQTACDHLLARLECCEAQEDSGRATPADWHTLAPAPEKLPALWLNTLQQRYTLATTSPIRRDETTEAALDHALLQVEALLDLPSPPDYQAARQQLKLQTMKQAMERRHTATNDPAPLINDLLRHPAGTARQHDRLRNILSSLRTTPPNTLFS